MPYNISIIYFRRKENLCFVGIVEVSALKLLTIVNVAPKNTVFCAKNHFFSFGNRASAKTLTSFLTERVNYAQKSERCF